MSTPNDPHDPIHQAEPVDDLLIAQRASELVDAGNDAGLRRTQAEVGRRVDDDERLVYT